MEEVARNSTSSLLSGTASDETAYGKDGQRLGLFKLIIMLDGGG